jgi:dethiobiotin synthetase
MNLFVTGTDTGIGKTVVSSILCLRLGYKYWKPVQSGLSEGTDSEWVGERIGLDNIHPEVYRLRQPLSPHLSAQLDEVEISLNRIVEMQPLGSTIIEGAGGLLVPLNKNYFMIDLITALQTKVVLVARAGLGTINHTLLSLEALRVRSIEPLGVILVGPRFANNKKDIENYGNTKVIGEIPFLENLDNPSLLQVSESLSMEVFL